jgi:hypothetical protein
MIVLLYCWYLEIKSFIIYGCGIFRWLNGIEWQVVEIVLVIIFLIILSANDLARLSCYGKVNEM